MEKGVVYYDNILGNTNIKVLDNFFFNKNLYIELQGELRECVIEKVITEYNGYHLHCKLVLKFVGIGEYTLDVNPHITQSISWKLYLSVEDYKNNKYISKDMCMQNVDINQILNGILDKKCINIQHRKSGYYLTTYKWNGVHSIEVYPQLPNVIIQDANGFHFDDIEFELPKYYATQEECEKYNNTEKSKNKIYVVVINWDMNYENQTKILHCYTTLEKAKERLKQLVEHELGEKWIKDYILDVRIEETETSWYCSNPLLCCFSNLYIEEIELD